jgi:glycosyltransferase involved in cell wall biosynthesis
MRIGLISTLGQPVPPRGSGSVESLVHLLAEGFVERGNDVTLFATEGSQTSARLCSPVALPHGKGTNRWDWQAYEAFNVSEAFRSWRDFDVIHCHSYHHGLLWADHVPIPSVHSLHVEPGPDLRFLAERTHNRHLVFCSRFQARGFEDISSGHVIPHGIDLRSFHVGERGDHLLFLGRFIPEKGALEAIRLARRIDVPLRLAAPANDYYREVLEPEVDGELICHVGEAEGDEKAELLANARALIYPCQRAEPFGLVLVEALASGLPVLALNRGAVPEIITHGVTGTLGDTLEDLEAGLALVDALDRQRIRGEAERRFSVHRMVEEFDRLMIGVQGQMTA